MTIAISEAELENYIVVSGQCASSTEYHFALAFGETMSIEIVEKNV